MTYRLNPHYWSPITEVPSLALNLPHLQLLWRPASPKRPQPCLYLLAGGNPLLECSPGGDLTPWGSHLGLQGSLTCGAWGPSGTLLALGTADRVLVWEAAGHQLEATIQSQVIGKWPELAADVMHLSLRTDMAVIAIKAQDSISILMCPGCLRDACVLLCRCMFLRTPTLQSCPTAQCSGML